MNPRSWTTRRRTAIAGAGLALATAVGIPAAAYAAQPDAPSTSSAQPAPPAQPGQHAKRGHDKSTKPECTPTQRWDALAAAAPKVSSYLDNNPAVASELAKLRSLPKDQRKAEAKTYFTANPQVKAALHDARGALITLHKDCRG